MKGELFWRICDTRRVLLKCNIRQVVLKNLWHKPCYSEEPCPYPVTQCVLFWRTCDTRGIILKSTVIQCVLFWRTYDTSHVILKHTVTQCVLFWRTYDTSHVILNSTVTQCVLFWRTYDTSHVILNSTVTQCVLFWRNLFDCFLSSFKGLTIVSDITKNVYGNTKLYVWFMEHSWCKTFLSMLNKYIVDAWGGWTLTFMWKVS